nr:MAG TPA: hypothetical protein [Bacteriophage sp.]
MKVFKSTDETLNSIYEEMYEKFRVGYYHYIDVYNVLVGALIYSYATDKISHKEFMELLQVIKKEITK